MKREIVLGISLSHNSAAAFVNWDYGVEFASSEERVYSKYNDNNFIKNTKRFPVGAIAAGLSHIFPENVQTVVWSNYEDPDLYHFVSKSLSPQLRASLLKLPPAAKILEKILSIQSQEELIRFRQQHSFQEQLAFVNALMGFLLASLFEIRPKKIVRIEHHTCHAYGALKTSGFTNGAMVITLDGFGDNIAGRVYKVENEKLICISPHTVEAIGSPGLFYQYVTGYIRLPNGERFKMLRDEYKLLGLEPHATKEYAHFQNILTNHITDNQNTIVWADLVKTGVEPDPFYESHPVKDFGTFAGAQQYFDKILQQAQQDGFQEFDIARAAQKRFEEVVLKWVETAIQPYVDLDLALSGGCFYNVKLNYQIKQLKQVRQLWIFPAAGDEGNSLGAAYAYLAEHSPPVVHQARHFYLGKSYTHEAVTQAIRCINERFKVNLSFQKLTDENHQLTYLTDLLATRKVVHIANTEKGVEFGPRALMVRSTLSHATSTTVNDKIQQLFKRYRYMPLAPVIKKEHAESCLIGFNPLTDGEITKYMILAYPCTNYFAQTYPAVVHPYHPEDIQKYGMSFSTRPQLIQHEDYSFAWDLLDFYERKTGEIALVNTSFNSHSSPILGDLTLLLLDWLSMEGESFLFLSHYFFDYELNGEAREKVGISWRRAKRMKSVAYQASKRLLIS